VVVVGPPVAWFTTVVVHCLAFLGVEALRRRRFVSFLASTALLAGAIGVAVTFVVLFRQHWRVAIAVLIAVAALALLAGAAGACNAAGSD
jgi:hypothetical protein